MDRSDERKDHQEGNVLDIGTPDVRTPVPSAETDEQRRRHRMEQGADEVMTAAQTEEPAAVHGHGATGADMGSGGDGTDIETPD